MAAATSLNHGESVVHYCFTPTADGITMELWEPKPSGVRSEPRYQFRLRYDFMSEREARAALHQYLATNSITIAIADPQQRDRLEPRETTLASTQ